METKTCTKCEIEKELSEFRPSKDGKFRVASRCKDCDKCYYQENKEQIKQKVKKYREQHKDELNKKHKEYIKKNKDKYINRKLIFLYGITLNDYNSMLENQNGVCAICSKKETRKTHGTLNKLFVDHNHKTNKVRGLLCNHCNRALGEVKENIIILKRMITYLNTTP